jgi:hypothetical protein
MAILEDKGYTVYDTYGGEIRYSGKGSTGFSHKGG